jgi:hypothetical protein
MVSQDQFPPLTSLLKLPCRKPIASARVLFERAWGVSSEDRVQRIHTRDQDSGRGNVARCKDGHTMEGVAICDDSGDLVRGYLTSTACNARVASD